eukprot:TRINITY_DN1835_c0_g2_i2.p1 TRINITY_DN1835_c0_g2~~TRINITY_DN1835_c0_g2_i2.p1  ORF type:complete len:283 (+),score=100.28 TRINITY_DN1835_c0_g2_i2:379-1227(+)
MQERMEKQLRPLMEQFELVKGLTPPVYRTLAEWEAKATAQQRASAMGLDSATQGQRGGQAGGANASPMPSVGETQVEVTIGNGGPSGAAAAGLSTAHKPIPQWVQRQEMNLTPAQRGAAAPVIVEEEDVKPNGVKAEGGGELSAEMAEEQERVRAYYAALTAQYYAVKQEQGGEAGAKAALFVKSEVKAERGGGAEVEEDDDEGVEWDDEGADNAYTGGADGGAPPQEIVMTDGGEAAAAGLSGTNGEGIGEGLPGSNGVVKAEATFFDDEEDGDDDTIWES